MTLRAPLTNKRGRIRCYYSKTHGYPECSTWAVKYETTPTSWDVAARVPVCHECSHEGTLEAHFGKPYAEIMASRR